MALTEFALGLPVFLALSLTGAELTNFIITKMRISQVALQVADNAARVGSGSLLSAKIVSETDINDLLIGADLQASGLDLYKHGRVVLSDLQPATTPNSDPPRYRIAKQRCRGVRAFSSAYGKEGDINYGMGAPERRAFAPDNGATMFVEVFYRYQPLVQASLAPSETIVETASMMVRDRRDLSGYSNAEGAAVARC